MHAGTANRKIKQIRREIVAVKREFSVSVEVVKGKSLGRFRHQVRLCGKS